MNSLYLTLAVALLAVSSATASIITFDATLDGPSESPPNASPGTGIAIVTIDDVAMTMEVNVQFSGLVGTATASHIHCCTPIADAGTAGVATTTPTFAGFPLGVTSGTYDNILDLTQSSAYNPAYVTANGGTPGTAETALLAGMLAEEANLNIHTTVVPGGEIRGFLQQVNNTPEPLTFLLVGSALAGMGLLRRRADLKSR